MKKFKFFFGVALYTLLSSSIQAQNWEFGLGLNAVNYQGDLVKPALFSLNETQPDFTAFVRHNFEGDKLALRLGLNVGKLSGNDLNFPDKVFRKFNFTTPLTELAATLEWSPLGTKQIDGSSRKVTPYFFGGFGFFFTSPTVFFNENDAPQPSNVKNGIAADKRNLKKSGGAVPLGAGIKFPMAKGTLGIEMGVRYLTNDYIDGISQAANPTKNDWYAIGGVNYAFRFGGSVDKMTDVETPNVTKGKELAEKATAEKAIKEKEAVDRINRAREAREQELKNKALKDKELADKVAREKESADKAINEKEAADKVAIEKETAAEKPVPEKDTDGDGVLDKNDKCPNTKGSPSNEGCPVMSTADTKTITEAISNIVFRSSSADFTGESFVILNRVADVLTRNPQYKVSIEGHTDSQGKEEVNLALSKARAEACLRYLATKGINSTRMTSDGFGSSHPIAPNNTEVNRRKNRRVAFILSL